MKNRLVIFFLAAVFAQQGALSLVWAESPQEMSWEDCVKEAARGNPDLSSARAKVEQSQADKALARSAALPQFSSSVSGSTTEKTNTANSRSFAYGVTGKQLLFDGFKTSNDIAVAKQQWSAARYDYEVTSSNVRLNLWSAFIDLINAQESLKVVEDIAGRRRQNLEMVKLRYQSGREHKGSLLTAQANLAQADFDVAQAQRDLELSQRRLSKVLGREKFVPVLAKGDLKIKDFDSAKPDFEELVNTVPFLKELAAKKEASRFGLKSAQADFFPQVYANASAGKSDSSWPPADKSWSVGFSVSLPIWEGGAQQAQLSKASSAYKQSQADEKSGRDGMIFTLAETWTNWQDGAEKVDVQSKFLEASRERAKIAEAQYSTGLVTFNDWTIIEDNLVRDQKAIVQSQASALIAQANWQQAKGVTLDE